MILKNVGPIKNCEVSITDFNVFTGAQASGKSTIAKAVFFFRTIKNDILKKVSIELQEILKTIKINYPEIFIN